MTLRGQLLQLLAAQNPGTPITLVLDYARYQRCRLVQDLAAELGIELLFLPSYSPNLNLIERLWKFVKSECLNGKYCETFDDFERSIATCLENLGKEHRDVMKTLLTRNFQLFDGAELLAFCDRGFCGGCGCEGGFEVLEFSFGDGDIKIGGEAKREGAVFALPNAFLGEGLVGFVEFVGFVKTETVVEQSLRDLRAAVVAGRAHHDADEALVVSFGRGN